MLEIRKQLSETLPVIRRHYDGKPMIAIILGTGLGEVAKCIKVDVAIPYYELPHFVVPTLEFHRGRLIFGKISDVPIVAMQGRFHKYEGWSMKEITYPVRVMKALGAKVLIVSNASGGMNPLFRLGDIMLITDHINLLFDNPLIGPNDDELGPRYPDMYDAYCKKLRDLAEQTALELGIRLVQGVYVAVTGPNLETAAEYRFLRIIGADAVGMSTVPEVIVARHSGMKVLGFSIITDMGIPDALEPISIESILKVAKKADKKMAKLMTALIPKIAKVIKTGELFK
ncbi:purine-nucleoside phosphorylase [bacterium]|nr:purine-nucleoside phosphorylase [bacterium]RKZ31412.1 MAG: purine-nucleoside phosphorylase [bacterium]